ncbi:hypothetical protein TURU_061601 [Turdus rufiventris]|nr:hypothetical protein TURU_061601 [Turdus rufiventris]
MIQQQSCDVVAITETWWDNSDSWNTALDGYKLFRRDRKGRRGRGVALYIREVVDAMAIEMNDDGVEYLKENKYFSEIAAGPRDETEKLIMVSGYERHVMVMQYLGSLLSKENRTFLAQQFPEVVVRTKSSPCHTLAYKGNPFLWVTDAAESERGRDTQQRSMKRE